MMMMMIEAKQRWYRHKKDASKACHTRKVIFFAKEIHSTPSCASRPNNYPSSWTRFYIFAIISEINSRQNAPP